MNNIEFYTDYSSSASNNIMVLLVYIQNRSVMLTNLYFETSGSLVISQDPMNFHIENVTVAFDNNLKGINIVTSCNYPEAVHDVLVYANNISFFYKEEKKVITNANAFLYQGSGRASINNFYSSIYMLYNEPYGQLQFYTDNN